MPDTMQRICFVMYLKPDRVDDYLAAHEHVWPEMLDALRESGWHNYSLFLRPDDGMVVGYVETEYFDLATKRMEQTAVNARWQERMSEYFQPAPGGDANPDTIRNELSQYFHLT